MTEVLLYLLNNKKCETQKKSTNANCRNVLHLEELRGNSWKKRKYQKLEINITK